MKTQITKEEWLKESLISCTIKNNYKKDRFINQVVQSFSEYYVEEEWLEEYQEYIGWDVISRCASFSDKFKNKYIALLEFNKLIYNNNVSLNLKQDVFNYTVANYGIKNSTNQRGIDVELLICFKEIDCTSLFFKEEFIENWSDIFMASKTCVPILKFLKSNPSYKDKYEDSIKRHVDYVCLRIKDGDIVAEDAIKHILRYCDVSKENRDILLDTNKEKIFCNRVLEYSYNPVFDEEFFNLNMKIYPHNSCPKMSEKFIFDNKNDLDFSNEGIYECMSESFIEKMKDYIDVNSVVRLNKHRHVFLKDLIIKNLKSINCWLFISMNFSFEEDELEKVAPYINFSHYLQKNRISMDYLSYLDKNSIKYFFRNESAYLEDHEIDSIFSRHRDIINVFFLLRFNKNKYMPYVLKYFGKEYLNKWDLSLLEENK